METFHSIFKSSSLNHFIISFILLSAALFPSLYHFLLKLLIYFSPLLSSTAISLMALYLFILSKEKPYREILCIEGEKGSGVVVQVCEEANFSLYKDHIRAGFLFLKGGEKLNSGLEEDDAVVFGGKVAVGRNIGEFVDSIGSYEVDCLAEGLWNCYFGRFSKWNHIESVSKEESDAGEEEGSL
ncbi:uncharacterized protein LOC110110455 [Dendrobium catenatum]|uniref:Uncharacterized protein n=1 Tax=Dendrobium catenatum TaxID=906689 RepID=A0A2I0VS14_9ASPA|nr:uncharacterized protein LOC110110455 [Dendrobium catenatum]PKU66199.1 hypothetical protein MA16_Dca009573 [Dendrobium catenatum]